MKIITFRYHFKIIFGIIQPQRCLFYSKKKIIARIKAEIMQARNHGINSSDSQIDIIQLSYLFNRQPIHNYLHQSPPLFSLAARMY